MAVGAAIAGGVLVVVLLVLSFGRSGEGGQAAAGEGRRAVVADSAPRVFAGPVTIRGRVIDGATAAGIQGAVVIVLLPGVTSQQWLEAPGEAETAELMAATTLTDGEGAYEIADLGRGGTYTVMVTATGYAPAIFEGGLEVSASDTPITGMQDIELEAR